MEQVKVLPYSVSAAITASNAKQKPYRDRYEKASRYLINENNFFYQEHYTPSYPYSMGSGFKY